MKYSAFVYSVALAMSVGLAAHAAAQSYDGTPDDFIQISQLYSKYDFHIDNVDGEGWAGDFTQDGVFSDPSTCLVGHKQLADFLGRKPQIGHDLDHFHFPSLGPIVYQDKDHATIHSTVFLVRETGAGKQGGIMVTGTYDDKLLRVNGKWKFAYRYVQRPSDKPRIPCAKP